MKIELNWKLSLDQMPKEKDKIVVYYKYDEHYSLLMGKFSFINFYGEEQLSLSGRRLTFTSTLQFTLQFQSVGVVKLSEKGFLWDYAKPSYNEPNFEKHMRRSKLKKIEKI